MSSRRAALAAIGLYSPCRTGGILLQTLARLAVTVAGPRALLGKPSDWSPPLLDADWASIDAQLRDHVADYDELAVYERPQPSRSGFSMLLLRQGRPSGFVRFRSGDSTPLDNERTALQGLAAHRSSAFHSAQPITWGSQGDWHYLATTVLPRLFHRVPRSVDLAAVVRQIRDGLAELPKPVGTPDHWWPMHGDLTPWNLRFFRGQGLALFDWEDSGWGPPHADEVHYRAAEGSLGMSVDPVVEPEAIGFWLDKLGSRTGRFNVRDTIGKGMAHQLEAWEQGSVPSPSTRPRSGGGKNTGSVR